MTYERVCAECGARALVSRKPTSASQYCASCAASRRKGMDLYARLDAYIEVDPDTTCWIWRRKRTEDGYGRISVGGRQRPTHRLNYERFVGPIPDGYHIDHLCRVRACCNPDHLEAVPPAVNVLRSDGRAAINARKVACIRGHAFTDENTIRYVDADGSEHRGCRTCQRLVWNRYDERRRARKRKAS